MTIPPTSRKRGRYHHGNLPAALVEAAIEVVAEVGVEALTLREVAHRVGVTHAAPYRHFKGKAVLLAAVAEEGFARLAFALRTARHERPRAATAAAGAAYLQFASREPALYRLMFAADNRPAGLRSAAAAMFAEVSATVLERAPLEDADTCARLLWASWHGLALLHAGELIDSNDREIELLASEAAERLMRAASSGPRSSRTRAGMSDVMTRLGHDDEPIA